MNPRPNREELAAWRAFLEAHHAVMAVLGEELEEIGLPIAFYDVLVQLSEGEPGGLRMADLARRVLLSKSGLTRLVDRMVGQGLVRRRPRPRTGAATTLSPLPWAAVHCAGPVPAISAGSRTISRRFSPRMS